MDSVRDYAEDLDLHLRLSEAGARLLSIDAVALIYRIHGANRSRAAPRNSRALLSALARGRPASSRMMREL